MGYVVTEDGLRLYYEEYGTGDRVIISAQVGFYPKSSQQTMAEKGYHVYCLTLRGFAPSDYVTEDYGDAWYDKFADDVVCLADKLGVDEFVYMGASHGAGLGWHLNLRHPERVKAFLAMVPGPHSLAEGVMSYRQMMMQGIIDAPPPFNPPIDGDEERMKRRKVREEWIKAQPEADPREKAVDYGRPLMRLGSEEKLCEALKTIKTPTLIIGGVDDPISTPELMIRTAKCLPHCKLVIYSNCGHDIDTDLIEEVTEEADRFLKQVEKDGRVYASVVNKE
ncbi:MAG: alpha/beta hydrolase [Lachnospiraceae bacterium]|nr:alpha/beta hydrolase [Lachnospiraceae bacterium]